jgi:hypothetical protein
MGPPKAVNPIFKKVQKTSEGLPCIKSACRCRFADGRWQKLIEQRYRLNSNQTIKVDLMICSASFGQVIIWISIGFCVTQSAAFSGLNLAIFSVSKLRLEVESASGNLDALTVLDLRKDSNFTLSTIVWGNVVTNGLLTLISTIFRSRRRGN